MKIYVSKSNCCNPLIAQVLKEQIKGKGHEVLEYKGGRYDPNIVLQSEQVLFITEDLKEIIGKGQHSEFTSAKNKKIPTYLVQSKLDQSQYDKISDLSVKDIMDSFFFTLIKDVEIVDNNDYRKHAKLIL